MEAPIPGARARLARARLHLLATRAVARLPLEEAVAAALRGGASVVQVREKDAPDAEVLALLRALAPLVRAAGALLLVDDRVEVALAAGADGVHLGPGDMPLAEARRRLGPERLLGASTRSLAGARAAEAAGADYVGIGPVYPTATKGVPVEPIGPAAAGEVARALRVPAFAIGGISPANASAVARAGCRRVAVCAAVLAAQDPEAAAREILEALGRGGA